MDKMLVCGTSAPGSIPGESTKSKGPLGAFCFALAEQSGGLLVRNRKAFEQFLELANRNSKRCTVHVMKDYPGESRYKTLFY